MTDEFAGFRPTLLEFLAELERNNRRDWFAANKRRYEQEVVMPSLAFISAMAAELERFAPRFRALPLRSGGSLMRIYRDTRFTRDKRPYKTNLGIQFRHEQGDDVHAPAYYFHVDAREVFVGVGAWRPPAQALTAIREHIHRNPRDWIAARDEPAFAARFALSGESLVRPPKGYGGKHPLIGDLKRKSFIAVHGLEHADLWDHGLVGKVAGASSSASPFMKFLCEAVGTPF